MFKKATAWGKKQHNSIPGFLTVLAFFQCTFWMLFSIGEEEWIIFWSNIIGILLFTFALICKTIVYYKNKNSQELPKTKENTPVKTEVIEFKTRTSTSTCAEASSSREEV